MMVAESKSPWGLDINYIHVAAKDSLTMSVLRGNTSADVSQLSASSVGVNACPDPLPGLILAPARAEKEGHSHTATNPPVHTNNCQYSMAADYSEDGCQSERFLLTCDKESSTLIKAHQSFAKVIPCCSGLLRCSLNGYE